jgi:hypothetical protein
MRKAEGSGGGTALLAAGQCSRRGGLTAPSVQVRGREMSASSRVISSVAASAPAEAVAAALLEVAAVPAAVAPAVASAELRAAVLQRVGQTRTQMRNH